MTLSSGNLRFTKNAGNGKSPQGIFPTEKEPKSEPRGLRQKTGRFQGPGLSETPWGRFTALSFFFVCSLFTSLALMPFSSPQAAPKKKSEFYLVVSKDSPLKSVSFDEVKQLYRRKTNEMQGQIYMPVHYRFTDEIRKKFSESVLDWPNVIREEETLRLIKFRNERTVPIQAASIEQMLEQVANGGTVGYVRSENLKNLPPDIKAIPIL